MNPDSEPKDPVNPLRTLIRVHNAQLRRRALSVRDQSRLLTFLIAVFIGGYAWLSFWLFHRGLVFLENFPGLGILLAERLMYLLFAFLFILLLFSNLIIGYGNLFRNRETHFLLSLPIPHRVVFQWKFIESTVLASWAFLFLVAPLLAAYGMAHHAPWHFYPATLVFTGLFLGLPAVAGAWSAIQLGRFLDRRTFQILGVAGMAGLIFVAKIMLTPETVTDEMLETRVLSLLDRLLGKTEFALFPWLPSFWLSSGTLLWLEGAMTAAGFYALVLLSYLLLLGFLAFTRFGAPFYDAASAVQSRASVLGRWRWFRRWQQRRIDPSRRPDWLTAALARVPGIESDAAALVAKDIRVFWRDTTQWGQSLMLFGLLGVYILNLRHFSHQLTNPFWIYLVSYLNLGACSLNLATLTTRFVYPQFSLEGKRIWFIGLAPMGLRRVVRIKFWLCLTASFLITVLLMFLSCAMLNIPWSRTLYFTIAVAVIAFTLNGLAVGLGALYPNFKEDQPSKIVSGFGGTFCLVMSFLYIVLSIVLLAVGSPWTHRGGANPGITVACWGGFIALSFTLGFVPLKLGVRKADQYEL